MPPDETCCADVPHAKLTEPEKDAARWRYVRDHLARAHSKCADGAHFWRLLSLPRGATVDEAIDTLIAQRETPT